MEDFVRPITLTVTDPETGREDQYVLDFSRESVRRAEGRGFKLNELADFPATKVPELFWMAFWKNHKRVSRGQADAIIEKMGGIGSEVLERLVQLYTQAGYTGVIQGRDEETEGKNTGVVLEM